MCDHKFFTNKRKRSLWDDQYVNFCQMAHQWHGHCAIEWCINGGKSVAFSKPTSIHANPQSLLNRRSKITYAQRWRQSTLVHWGFCFCMYTTFSHAPLFKSQMLHVTEHFCPVGTTLCKWHSEGSTSFRMYPAYIKNSTSC